MERAVRIAHFSDIHVTLSPLAGGRYSGKRVLGALNYYIGRRSARFRGCEQRIASLLLDVDAQGVDHAICTGDLTAMSYAEEFSRCAELFGERRLSPDRYTVIPGNHDRYVFGLEGDERFEHWFSKVCEGARFPFAKELAGGVTIVGVDAARPVPVFDSSGLCGKGQLEKARALIEEQNRKQRFVILAIHYALLRADRRPDSARHGLRDYREVLSLIENEKTRVDLVLHGHLHNSFSHPYGPARIFGAGSATDLHHRCGYNVYTIDPLSKQIEVERREWNAMSQTYERRV